MLWCSQKGKKRKKARAPAHAQPGLHAADHQDLQFCEKLLYIPYHSRPAGHYCYLPALCLLTFRKRFSEGKPSCSPACRAHPAEHPAAATALQHLLPFPALRPAEPTLPLTEPGIVSHQLTQANLQQHGVLQTPQHTAMHRTWPSTRRNAPCCHQVQVTQ